MADWYVNYGNGSSTGYYAVAQFAISHAYVIGDIVRQLATPAVGNERCFRCTTAGTSGGSEPAWNIAKGTTTTSGGATFTEVTGNATYNEAAPHARLLTALGSLYAAAGDRIVCIESHAETQASAMQLNATNATLAAPINIICVKAGASVPPVSADKRSTATVSATAANSITFISPNTDSDGVNYSCGSGASAVTMRFGFGSVNVWTFRNCDLKLNTTDGGSFFWLGANVCPVSRIRLVNATMTFGAAGQSILLADAQFEWLNTASAIGGTAPTNLFSNAGGGFTGKAAVEGVDLSAMGSGKTLANMNLSGSSARSGFTDIRFKRCRINAAVTAANLPNYDGMEVVLDLCDSGANAYRHERHNVRGDLTTETTIVRTGGAQDTSGGTTYSHKIVSTANTTKAFPFRGTPFIVWVDTTGSSKTVTVEFENDGTTLQTTDLWFEAQYLGDASFPDSSMATSGEADFIAAGSSYATSSETWTTTGQSSPVKQHAVITFTTQMKGYVEIAPMIAKASKTLYVCPKVAVA